MLLKGKYWQLILMVTLLFVITLSTSIVCGAEPQIDKDSLLAEFRKADIDWRQQAGSEIRVLVYSVSWQQEFEPYLSIFEELTGIKVKWEVLAMQQQRQKMTMDVTSGANQYDIWATQITTQGLELYEAGWAEHLNKYISNAKLTDEAFYRSKDLLPVAVEQGTYDNELIYAPALLSATIMFYRKDLFEERGLEVPTTWEELYDVASEINDKRSGMAGITMRGEGYEASMPYASFFRSADGEWLDEKGTNSVFQDGTAGIRSLTFYSKLLRDYGPPGSAGYGWADAIKIFQEGKAAMIIDDLVFSSSFEDPSQSKVAGKVGYAMQPGPGETYGPGKSRPLAAGFGLAMNSRSKNKDASWLFLQYATSIPISRNLAARGIPVARTSVYNDPIVEAAFSDQPDMLLTLQSTFENADPFYYPRIMSVGEFRRIIGIAITRALEGDDIEKALDEAARSLDQVLETTR